jgi:starch-binding outer membrane protein, SusD/RagB family
MNLNSKKLMDKAIMKRQTKITSVLAVVAFAILLYGCDDYLDVPPKGALSEEVLADQQGVEALLIGAYAALDGQDEWTAAVGGGSAWEASPDNWIYGSVTGGDAHKGSDATDQAPINQIQQFTADASLGFFDSKWKALYEGVSRTNDVLSVLQIVEDDEMMPEDQIVAEAEARFLRAHYYFELRKMFYRVPWIDENTEDLNQPNDREIWPDIKADLEFAMNNLPDTQSDRARANRWAAATYLGKVYVYQENWGEAASIFSDVIQNGVTSQGVSYDLLDSPRDVWDPSLEDGNPENIFYLQMVATDGTVQISHSNQGMMLNFPYNSPFRCCGFYQPTQDLVQAYRTDSGLPILDVEERRSEVVTNDQGVSTGAQFETYQGTLDPRLDWTVGRRGVPYHDWGPHPGNTWIRDQGYAGPYAPKKHVYWRSQESDYANNNSWAPGTAINYPVIRFADVLLLAAEAEVQNGNSEQARQYVNRVRARAANPDGWVSNDLNREYASAIVSTVDEVTSQSVSSGSWVVVNEDNSTYVYLGGGTGDISNWNRYEEPNYEISEYSAADWGSIDPMEAIQMERRLELAMEGHRFFDLARWGIAEQELNSYFEWESSSVSGSHGGYLSGSTFQSGRNEYFPVPQRQIDLSEGVLEQPLY